jgi:hypothetical protein
MWDSLTEDSEWRAGSTNHHTHLLTQLLESESESESIRTERLPLNCSYCLFKYHDIRRPTTTTLDQFTHTRRKQTTNRAKVVFAISIYFPFFVCLCVPSRVFVCTITIYVCVCFFIIIIPSVPSLSLSLPPSLSQSVSSPDSYDGPSSLYAQGRGAGQQSIYHGLQARK